ncbi:MAG: MarR family transcriptional regulator [Pirellulales bacterium]|nr:MarR family transcriptional regulator [Pirellulales bacterium]
MIDVRSIHASYFSLAMSDSTQPHKPSSLSDRSIVDHLRQYDGCTISQLVDFAGVTATAIRQRVNRLTKQGLVVRQVEPGGRGRPTYRYSLSPAGVRASGDNYEDLAQVLWSEIRAVKDPEVRHGLLKRLVVRMADVYRSRIKGDNLGERMESLVSLMRDRDVPFEVRKEPGSELPVLTALACPYPELAEQDRGICSMEKMLFSEILGQRVRLSACRLDGENCCTFETSSTAAAVV